jgi:hypothetical protein
MRRPFSQLVIMRLIVFFFIQIFIFSVLTSSGFALSQAQNDVFNSGIRFFNVDIDTPVCSTGSGGIGADNIDNSTIWSSGLQPPYILEQFAIETLKDVAKKENADPSSAVTQEHVIALIAFMFGEGGDINNTDLFNPLNTGLNAPELISGASANNGTQSFKSFDAGVEATARTITGSYQSRLAAVLMQPTSTAQQFMYALSYYDHYPGNKFWAEASVPPLQDSYYQVRLQLVGQVRNNYANTAGLIVGTPAFEEITNQTDKSKLIYHPTSDTSSSTDAQSGKIAGGGNSADCGASAVSGSVVQTAINYAWDTSGHGISQADAKPSYQTDMPKYNGSTGENPFSDCGVFISTVMIASGADPTYPKRGTPTQRAYLSSSSKYTEIHASDTSGLKPGDIFISTDHTYMYIGPQPNGKSVAEASLGDHVPEMDSNAYFGGFQIFRLNGAAK